MRESVGAHVCYYVCMSVCPFILLPIVSDIICIHRRWHRDACTRLANCSADVIKRVLADGAGHLWERTVKVVSYTTFLKERQQNLTAFLHAALTMDPMVEDRDSTPADVICPRVPCGSVQYINLYDDG